MRLDPKRLLGRCLIRFVQHGKGSHGRLSYGERFTTLKERNVFHGS